MTRPLGFRTLLFFVLIALLALASGFLSPLRVVAAQTASAEKFDFGGLTRTYRVFRPATLKANESVPLVVVLHGGFGTGLGAERSFHWDDAATRFGFVVLYPDGVARTWNAGECCGKAERDNVDDVGFLSALVDRVANDDNIDRTRIFFTGISNGAMMSYRMACESPLDIAAIGPVAGTLTVPCDRARPTSVLAIHGLADHTLTFDGSLPTKIPPRQKPVARRSVPDTIAQWRGIDACGAPATRTYGPVTELLSGCAQNRDVELITVAGAGHQWPGAVPPSALAEAILPLDEPSTALDATVTLWNFFAEHRS
jgi:polyhydroxybutyrate depolymerase